MNDTGKSGRNDIPATTGERPTLKTIAYMTGLGITTVSRALKDAPDIGAETLCEIAPNGDPTLTRFNLLFQWKKYLRVRESPKMPIVTR